MSETSVSPLEQALGRYAHFLQWTKEMAIVGHRGPPKPLFASIFDREMRESVHKRVMREAQRTFDAHTGYGLYFALKPAEG